MANTITLSAYADHIMINLHDVSASFKIWKSYTNDINYADEVHSVKLLETELEDRSVVQGHTYYYWLTTALDAVVDGPHSSRLVQRKLFGRGGGLKGAKRTKTFDYDVACPLCGRTCRRNTLRRGYVRPHETGRNYLPYSAAPEEWTMSPTYFDANNWNWWINSFETDPEFVFPCIDKESDWRTPPDQNRFPGCPLLDLAPIENITMGTPSSILTGGYVILWVYVITSGADLQVLFYQGVRPVVTGQPLNHLQTGCWHRLYYTGDWDATWPVTVRFLDNGSEAALVFGGAMLTNSSDETSWYPPHRSTGSGVYTTGGMMDLCSECFSGLRKRVPWG